MLNFSNEHVSLVPAALIHESRCNYFTLAAAFQLFLTGNLPFYLRWFLALKMMMGGMLNSGVLEKNSIKNCKAHHARQRVGERCYGKALYFS